MKFLSVILFLILFSSCDYINFKEEKTTKELPIASLLDVELYKKDIQNLLPKNIPKEDSLIFVKSIINSFTI